MYALNEKKKNDVFLMVRSFGVSQLWNSYINPFMDRGVKSGCEALCEIEKFRHDVLSLPNISRQGCLSQTHVYVCLYYFSLFFFEQYECIQPSNGKPFFSKISAAIPKPEFKSIAHKRVAVLLWCHLWCHKSRNRQNWTVSISKVIG